MDRASPLTAPRSSHGLRLVAKRAPKFHARRHSSVQAEPSPGAALAVPQQCLTQNVSRSTSETLGEIARR